MPAVISELDAQRRKKANEKMSAELTAGLNHRLPPLAVTGRPCTVCTHPDRAQIDGALITRAFSLRSLAARFGVSAKALERHRVGHVPTEAVRAGAQAVAADEGLRGGALMAKASNLLKTAEMLLSDAMMKDQPQTALRAIREAGRMVELCAKLSGDIEAGATVNVLVAPAFVTIRQTMLVALAGFPDARAAVVRALEGVQ